MGIGLRIALKHLLGFPLLLQSKNPNTCSLAAYFGGYFRLGHSLASRRDWCCHNCKVVALGRPSRAAAMD